jgi:hypothetical protein
MQIVTFIIFVLSVFYVSYMTAVEILKADNQVQSVLCGIAITNIVLYFMKINNSFV